MVRRIALEQKPRLEESFRILPFEFHINNWCRYDLQQPADAKAFEEFCGLTLGNGYISLYWMPKFIAEIDTSGLMVAGFVEKRLKANPSITGDDLTRLAYLASAYADSSAAWAHVANPICEKAAALTRDERERVFFGLTRKGNRCFIQCARRSLPDFHVQVRDLAIRIARCRTLRFAFTRISRMGSASRRGESSPRTAESRGGGQWLI